MDALIGAGILVLIVFVIRYLRCRTSVKNLPPGPPRKFLIGNTFDLNPDRLHISFTDISGDYGDVFSVQASGKTVIVVNTIEAFRELYLENKYGEILDGRERTFVAQVIAGDMGVPLASNTAGLKLRRGGLYEAIKALVQRHSHKLHEEINSLVQLVASQCEEPQDLSRPIQLYLANINMLMLTGERYDYDDPRLIMTIERANIVQEFIRPRINSVMTMFPWLRYLPFGYGKSYGHYVHLTNKLKETVFDPVKDSFHSDELRGGIDQLLKIQKETLGNVASELTDEYLNMSSWAVVGAGTAVPFGNFLYFFVVILHHPEIAENMQKEMDSVLGRSRLPTLADRSRMTYAQAVVLELLRWASPAPLLVPRRADDDVQFRGYTIPKDATVITNAWKILHDPDLWEKPWEFRPERFIGAGGDIRADLQRNVIAFGGGRRKCIGVDLAMDFIFLFVTSLFQRFDFTSVDGQLPALDPHLHSVNRVGITPEEFKVIVKPRVK